MDRGFARRLRSPAISTPVCVAFACFAILLLYWYKTASRESSLSADHLLRDIEVQLPLAEHSKEFNIPTVIKVTEGVYVAVGYALANSILLEGPGEEAIIVDVTENVTTARMILTDFRKHTSKRITDIVFTHNHGDHVLGAEGFIEDVQNLPNIWAYHTFSDLAQETYVVGHKLYRGVIHQMGVHLGNHLVNSGLGPQLHLNASRTVSREPNRLIQGQEEEHTLAGINLTFIHIPGETSDQLAIWLPSKRVLLPADNIYKTFPNLYAIRGTPPRNTMIWHDSLRRMRALEADYLVPSHTRPVSGKQKIFDILTAYMTALQYVHDQTVRHLNAGLHPDEIAARVSQLPQSLASHRYLQQFYGNTIWSSKGIYETYIGWFSGDVTDLLPLSPKERSRRMVTLIGSEKLLDEARMAMMTGELQWSLELVSHVFRTNPKDSLARNLRLEVLRNLAKQQSNPIARNYYMTTILDDHGLIDWKLDHTQLINKLPVKVLLDLMRYQLNAEAVEGVNITAVICFTDLEEEYHLQIAHSVLHVELLPTSCSKETSNDARTKKERQEDDEESRKDDGTPDIVLSMTSKAWRELLNKTQPTDNIRLDLDILQKLKQFLSYFQS